jgi:hypothetical protein
MIESFFLTSHWLFTLKKKKKTNEMMIHGLSTPSSYQFMDAQNQPSHVYMYEFLTCIQGRRKNDPSMRALKDWVKAITSFRTK